VGALGTLIDSFHGPVVTMGSLAQSDGEGALCKRSCSRGAFRPSFVLALAPPENRREQGEPGGRCTRGPRAEKNARSAKTTGTGGSNRPSLRSGLRLIRDLLGEPAFATVALAKPLELRKSLAQHGCARTTRFRRPWPCRSSDGIFTSTAIPLHVRDDAYAPLIGTERAAFCVKSEIL
jgi:hypothetical protein